jgi:GT2 family glycosyltransferase
LIDLTIVIVSHETSELLTACLAAVERACRRHPELGVETIVVDNGSRDASVGVARSSPLQPKLIALARNRGFAAAVNLGLRARRGRHVLLLNSDAEIDPDVLVRGVGLLDDASDVGVIGAALVHPDGRPQRSVHAFPGLQTELLPEPILRIFRPNGFPARGRSMHARAGTPMREVEAVRGAAFFVRGELLEKLGLFDEGYFFFLEETDYCWRVAAAGYRVVHSDALRVVHQLGASSKRRAPLATRIEFHRSLYRFLDRRRGPRIAALSRVVRSARTAVGLVGRAAWALGSKRGRGRLAERWGLLLWHLRGCPNEPSLAQALELRVRSQTPTPAWPEASGVSTPAETDGGKPVNETAEAEETPMEVATGSGTERRCS